MNEVRAIPRVDAGLTHLSRRGFPQVRGKPETAPIVDTRLRARGGSQTARNVTPAAPDVTADDATNDDENAHDHTRSDEDEAHETGACVGEERRASAQEGLGQRKTPAGPDGHTGV